MEKIIQKIQEQIGAGIYPGASLALYQKGSWQEYYLGLDDPAKQEPLIAGLTYDLASVSKRSCNGACFSGPTREN